MDIAPGSRLPIETPEQLSYLLDIFRCMSGFEVECAHCHRWFQHPWRSGRRRIYCRRSCRQRAYECRRQLLPPARPAHLGPTDPTTTERPVHRPPAQWLEGQSRPVFGRLHALLSGAPDSRGRFPTLCGTHARPGIRAFSELRPTSCRTCSRLARVRPAPSPCRPAFEWLSTKGHLVQVGRALAMAERSAEQPTIATLQSLLRRALEPVLNDLVIAAARDSTTGPPGRA